MLVAVNTAKHAVFVELGDDRQVVAAFPKSLNGSLRAERSKTSCLNGWLMPPGCWPSGAMATTMFGPICRWEIGRLHKRRERRHRTKLSRPARSYKRRGHRIEPLAFCHEEEPDPKFLQVRLTGLSPL